MTLYLSGFCEIRARHKNIFHDPLAQPSRPGAAKRFTPLLGHYPTLSRMYAHGPNRIESNQ